MTTAACLEEKPSGTDNLAEQALQEAKDNPDATQRRG